MMMTDQESSTAPRRAGCWPVEDARRVYQPLGGWRFALVTVIPRSIVVNKMEATPESPLGSCLHAAKLLEL
jgi:hypothetical protein